MPLKDNNAEISFTENKTCSEFMISNAKLEQIEQWQIKYEIARWIDTRAPCFSHKNAKLFRNIIKGNEKNVR